MKIEIALNILIKELQKLTNITEQTVINPVSVKTRQSHSQETKEKISEKLKEYHANKQNNEKETEKETKKETKQNNHLSEIKDRLKLHGQTFTKGFSKVESFFSEITAPFKEIGNIIHGGFDMLRSGLGHLHILPKFMMKDENAEDMNLDESKKQTGLLENLLSFFKKEDLEDKRKVKEKDKGIFDTLFGQIGALLLGISTGLGFIIGGITGYIILPFKLLFKGLQKLKFIGQGIDLISDVIKSLNLTLITKLQTFYQRFTSIFSPTSFIGKIISKIGGVFNKIIGIFKFTERGTQFLSKIVTAFKTGFLGGMAKLAWPITILMGLFDFVKGFKITEGDFIDKIAGGISNVITKMFDIIIAPLGWIIDKISGMFGIDIGEGFANKIRNGIDFTIKGIFNIFKSVIENFTKPFENFINQMKTFKSESTIDFIWELIKKLPQVLFDSTLGGIYRSLVDIFEWGKTLIPFTLINDIKENLIKFGTWIKDNTIIGRVYTGIKNLLNTSNTEKTLIDKLKEQFITFTTWLLNHTIVGKVYLGLFNLFNTSNTEKTLIDKLKEQFITFATWLLNNTIIGKVYLGLFNLFNTSNTEKTLIDKLKEQFIKFGTWIKDNTIIGRVYTGIKNLLTSTVNEDNIFDKFLSEYNKFVDWFTKDSIIGKSISGIKNLYNKITGDSKKEIPIKNDVLKPPYKKEKLTLMMSDKEKQRNFVINRYKKQIEIEQNKINKSLSGDDQYGFFTNEKKGRLKSTKKIKELNDKISAINSDITHKPLNTNYANTITQTEDSIKQKKALKEQSMLKESKNQSDIFNKNIQQYHKDMKSMNEINKNTNITQISNEKEIPDEVENLSLIFFNKNWGIS